jgi:hypothetical protein
MKRTYNVKKKTVFKRVLYCMISGFHCSVNEVFALLGCYTALIGS